MQKYMFLDANYGAFKIPYKMLHPK